MTISRATVHSPVGNWPSNIASDSLSLDFDARHRRRIRMTSDCGQEVLLDLPKTVAMSDGDGLQLEDGRWLRICAAPEPIVQITHPDPMQLTRIAWHLGNRHLPTQMCQHELRIRPDHVIEHMLEGLGARLTHLKAPFQPEGGAYNATPQVPHRHE